MSMLLLTTTLFNSMIQVLRLANSNGFSVSCAYSSLILVPWLAEHVATVQNAFTFFRLLARLLLNGGIIG